METLAKTSILPARQNQFLQETFLNNPPVRRIVNAMNTNSAFTRSYTENPFWYQQFNLRQIRILRGGRPILVFDAADNCRFYVTTIKALKFQDDIPSTWFDLNAGRYRKFSLPGSSWRTLVTGAKLYLPSTTRYWTHCTGRTYIFGCSLQVWHFWEENLKKTTLLSIERSIILLLSSIGTWDHSHQIMFQFLQMRLLSI